MPRLALVILAVEDARRSAAFYRDAFGWSVTVEEDVYVELALPERLRLGLYRRDGYARNTGVEAAEIPADRAGPAELYVHVDDLGEMLARVTRAGGRVLSERARRPWGDEVGYVADPDGHVVAIAVPGAG